MAVRKPQQDSAPYEHVPVRAIVAEDAFMRRRMLAEVMKRLKAAMSDDLQISTFDGKEAELAEVLDEARTVSMFGGVRVVIVDEGGAFVTRYREAIERYLDGPSPSGVILLVCASLDRRFKIYKTLAARSAVAEHEAYRGRSLNTWLVRHAEQAYGKRMTDRTAALIRELAGDEMGILDMELAKLATYVGERREIQEADVEALLSFWREENVFAVLDAMADGDTAAALMHWRQALATSPGVMERMIGGLAWSVRRLLQAREAMDHGQSAPPLAYGMRCDPAVLERRLSRVTARDMEAQLSDLHRVDLATKTGSNAALAVEKWIVTHSRRTAGVPGRGRTPVPAGRTTSRAWG